MLVKALIRRALRPLQTSIERSIVAQLDASERRSRFQIGSLAVGIRRSQEALPSLQSAEFKVSSQCGEDGIFDWLVERVRVPARCQSFIEFGVEDYRESNTRFLLQNRNWRGLIIDGSSEVVGTVTSDGLTALHDLTARVAFITRENINDLILGSGFGGEIGILSIDIDGNDYWVWEALTVVQPIMVVCEYNAVFGDRHPLVVPYESEFSRAAAHFSLLYAGASIAALCQLAYRKGYSLVGTNSAGNNAFFIRNDYAKGILNRSLAEIVSLPSKFRESRDPSGAYTFVGGLDRFALISDLPVVNVETGVTRRLGDIEGVYSDKWLEIMTGNRGNSSSHRAYEKR
jgi:hypothetical protein